MRWIAGLVFFASCLSCLCAFAGGPLNVAGVSAYKTGLVGTPIIWANGQVNYYTDQGDLSPLLPGTAADQFVADAFARWTSVSTAALKADRSGSLNEDVNGTNVILINGVLSLPDDVQPASSKPLAIVYDSDGRVTDALMGAGAGAAELCNTNSIYAQPNRFDDDAHIAHALIIINGNCAKTPAQLPILKYRLVRAVGRVLGLDFSQLNDNVVFGSPSPGVDDYAGFPVMHPLAVLCSEASCLPNADVPRMDDRAAISRLYPVTAANRSAYAGKTVFKDNTGRIYGSVRFPASKGTIGQGMQGVNVVARMVDPVTSRVSRSYASSSVSGFLFRGNAGNPMTGYYDALHRRLDSSGSNDPVVEGFFDLAGLEIPSGYASVTYELSVEPVNPLYTDSSSVGPYRTGPVTPSGTAQAMRVTVRPGLEVSQDIYMEGAASERQDQYEPNSFLFPAAVPAGGDWLGSLSGYGDIDYMYFTARANRTFTFDVTALDAANSPTTVKAQPVLGAWDWSDPEEQPRASESFFNLPQTAATRLQAEVISNADYKLGIADYRGDGRPDYRYEARLLYADDVAPSRASVRGGTVLTISGIGFSSSMQVQVGTTPLAITPVNANQMVVRAPALQDATYSVTVMDTVTGASSVMENVLHVGSADARLVLLGGSNPQVPVGTQAPNPMRVQVVDSNTGDPVAGATVNFSVPASASIVGCNLTNCTMITDQNGVAGVYLLVKSAGASLIQATLPTGGSTAVTINGVAAALEITLDHPTLYVASGVSASFPVTATVVANGAAVPNRTVNFVLNSGSATFQPASSLTDSRGVATSTISVTKLISDVNISACVAPNNAPCRTLIIHPVAAEAVDIQRVSGDQQLISVGQSFAPLTVKVVDVNANAVAGMAVQVLVDVYRAPNDTVRVVRGEAVTFTRDEPVVLSTSGAILFSDANGMVTLPINVQESQPVQIIVQAVAGQAEVALLLRSIWALNGDPAQPSSVRGEAMPSVHAIVKRPVAPPAKILTVDWAIIPLVRPMLLDSAATSLEPAVTFTSTPAVVDVSSSTTVAEVKTDRPASDASEDDEKCDSAEKTKCKIHRRPAAKKAEANPASE